MLNWMLRKIVGTKNERELKRMAPMVVRVNELEPRMKALRTEEMPRLTAEWKEQIQKGRLLEEVLPEAFALVREASIRSLGMRHFDVQLIGGVVLHEGKIAEMKTGEGKTLVATLPCFLNALSGRGVHVVTVNDYLARRDAEWMGRLYTTVGMRTGVVVHGLTDAERQDAYGADITYGQNNEFGFDYLRDNMKFRLQDYVQRELNFAIVDEVDSILIDEARTPLIISGPSDESSDKYYQVNRLIPSMIRDVDFTVDEKTRTVVMSDAGVEKMEQKLGIQNLYDPEQIEWLHHVEQALRAHHLYRNEVDYVVKEGEVLIVDEFTGRLMPGRRWSDGLHQAVEAKEGVKIEAENQTLATISFQNYFRMYSKLAGMTGTAETEAEEFAKIYDLDVVMVPTNQRNIRSDSEDVVYKTEREKFNAICEEIEKRHAKGQPILVGTVSVAKSEVVASILKKRGIPHNVLNAKHHQREAEIVAQAGRKGSVTISTNMAGRGTDILLGGNPEMMAKHEVGPEPDAPMEGETGEAFQARKVEWAARLVTRTGELKVQTAREHDDVVAVGGLHIVGTERHESRRIDNQLRGRSGRQGDPGESLFYLSLEDDLMRMFASDRVASIMERLKWPDDEAIEAKMVSRAVENAQKQIEELNYERRKNVLKYDDVMNAQREAIYGQRREILEGRDLKDQAIGFVEEVVGATVDAYCPADVFSEDWELDQLSVAMAEVFPTTKTPADLAEVHDVPELQAIFIEEAIAAYEAKEATVTPEVMRELERVVLLNITDTKWREHLYEMDYLQEGIHLRSYAQKDPITEYRREAYEMYQELTESIRADFVRYIYRVELVRPEAQQAQPTRVQDNRAEVESQGRETANANQAVSDKTPRNAPCPCGSGKKYKKCHGAAL